MSIHVRVRLRRRLWRDLAEAPLARRRAWIVLHIEVSSVRQPPTILVATDQIETQSVPKIVPASAKNQASGANGSQMEESRKSLRGEDLRGKTTIAEMLIGV